MPKINYQHQHTLSNEEAQKRIQEMCQRFSRDYHFHVEWIDSSKAKVSGTGVSGDVQLKPGTVSFTLDLSFLLSPFKNKIETEIAKELGRALS